ncbi:MAG: LytTR family DNA-binding domain-containing protein [Bacteroidota bacterium]
MSHKIVNPTNAIYMQASESYCILKLEDGKCQVKTRPMKFFINILENHGWCRIHKSFMVNPLYVSSLGESHDNLCLQNGQILPISRRNKQKVLEWCNSENPINCLNNK